MQSNSSGIYKIENMLNGKCYVGSAVILQRRLSKHKTELSGGKHHSQKLQRAWNKYGPEAFLFEVIEYVDDPKTLISREQEWIDTFMSAAKGYNVCAVAGSCLGVTKSQEAVARTAEAHRGMKRSDETRGRIREARAKQPPMTDEGRLRLSLALSQRVVSDETRAKLSAAHKGRKMTDAQVEANRQRQLGRKMSDATKEKVRMASTGRKHTEESRKKMSEWQIGRKMPSDAVAKSVANRAGYQHSDETKRRISERTIGVKKSAEHSARIAAALCRPEVVAKRLETIRLKKLAMGVALPAGRAPDGEAFQK